MIMMNLFIAQFKWNYVKEWKPSRGKKKQLRKNLKEKKMEITWECETNKKFLSIIVGENGRREFLEAFSGA